MVTTKTGTYMESKVRLERIGEDGTPTKFNELYVVDAQTFSECEEKMNGYVSQYAQGEFNILTEVYAKYKEIFFSDDNDENTFYRAQVSFITLDEKSGKERRSKIVYLVHGKDIDSAKRNIDEVMGQSMVDYVIESISETAIQDYIG